jgi:hypothetical protein
MKIMFIPNKGITILTPPFGVAWCPVWRKKLLYSQIC